MVDIDTLAAGIVQGSRRDLAKGITLIESTRANDRREAEILLALLLPHMKKDARRIGISGPPGVGKSTFIEALGPKLLSGGRKLAILAVDPVSPLSGGSILGDKTRMANLVSLPEVFVRPSPGQSDRGGVGTRTYEVMMLCEAAGFDWIIIETIGAGQSEMAVAGMTDMFVALMAPGGGDELQGIKRGMMELADLLIVTKADGDLLGPAERTKMAIDHARHLIRPRREHWKAQALMTSSYQKQGLDETLGMIDRFFESEGDALSEVRGQQNIVWFHKELIEEIKQVFLSLPGIKREITAAEDALRDQKTLSILEARRLVRHFLSGS